MMMMMMTGDDEDGKINDIPLRYVDEGKSIKQCEQKKG